jgi:hypothetical protein
VVGEIRGLGKRVLEGRKLLADLGGAPGNIASVDVLKVRLVVDVVERVGRVRFRRIVTALFGFLLIRCRCFGVLLEDRVLDELLLDLFDELQLGHLEELDGLLERRCHDEPLAHPDA